MRVDSPYDRKVDRKHVELEYRVAVARDGAWHQEYLGYDALFGPENRPEFRRVGVFRSPQNHLQDLAPDCVDWLLKRHKITGSRASRVFGGRSCRRSARAWRVSRASSGSPSPLPSEEFRSGRRETTPLAPAP